MADEVSGWPRWLLLVRPPGLPAFGMQHLPTFAAARRVPRCALAEATLMKFLIPVLTFVYAAIAAVFGAGAVCLLGLSAVELWDSVAPGQGVTLPERAAAA